MDLTDVLRHAHVSVDGRFADKGACLAGLAQRAAGHLAARHPAARHPALASSDILDALTHRESLGSTGLGRGIALPHARLAGVVDPYVALARLRDAIPFDAVDDKPVDIVCLVLLPDAKGGGQSPGGQSPAGQLNVLAGIARRLRDPATLAAIRGGGAQAIRDVLVRSCAPAGSSSGQAK